MMSTQQNLADAHSTELEVLAARLIDNHPFDTDDVIFEALKHAYELGKQHQDQTQFAGAERFLVSWEMDDTNNAASPREAALLSKTGDDADLHLIPVLTTVGQQVIEGTGLGLLDSLTAGHREAA